jgi:hypothetical protein
MVNLSLTKNRQFAARLISDESQFIVTYNGPLLYSLGATDIKYTIPWMLANPRYLTHIMGGFLRPDEVINFYNESKFNRALIRDTIDKYAYEREVIIPKIYFLSQVLLNIETKKKYNTLQMEVLDILEQLLEMQKQGKNIYYSTNNSNQQIAI